MSIKESNFQELSEKTPESTICVPTHPLFQLQRLLPIPIARTR